MRRILYKQSYTSLRLLSSTSKLPRTRFKMSDNKGEEQRESHSIAGLSLLGCKHCHLTGEHDISWISFHPIPRPTSLSRQWLPSNEHPDKQNSVSSPTQPRATTPPTSTLSPQRAEVFNQLPPTHTTLEDLMFPMTRLLRV
jgi:hypothetical protein